MKHRRILTTLLFSIVLTIGAIADEAEPETHPLTDSLYSELTIAKTPADSLSIMSNLFDLLPMDKGALLGLEIFDVANRTNNISVALEMLRNLANRYLRNDSMLVELYNRTLPYSKLGEANLGPALTEELRETRTFIKLSRNMYRARYANPEERRQLLMDFLQTSANNPPSDIHDRIILQHSVCMVLSHLGANDILSTEMDKLGEMVDELPMSDISLRNAYNVHAAVIYTDNGEYEKAMRADKRTLEGIAALEKHYKSIGRKYRNYDANRYIIYNRILSNYPALAPNEIEKYYKLAMDIVNRNYTAAVTNASSPGPQIYYNLSYKNYAKALALIKSCIDHPYNKRIRLRFLKEAVTCAKALNDNDALLQYTLEYNKYLEDELRQRLDIKYREVKILADNSEITNKYNQLQYEKERAEAKSIRIIMIVAILAVIILLIFVVILFRLNRKNSLLVKTLNDSNKALREESKNLEKSRKDLMKARDIAQKANNMKTDFIKNMSYEVSAPLKSINEYCKLIVDCADASNRKYLERFTSLVELNSELLTTIVNDVLHISEIDSESVPVHNRSTDLRGLCSMVLNGVRHRIAPDVALQFDASSPAISLYTDPQRLHQILLNLLTNAAKFTSKGSITLGYSVDEKDEQVVFNVTDTGIGIKADKKDVIFERFVKLDKETQGAGLGLTISRMLAKLLGGDVYLDTSYTKGARFILKLPKK